MQALRAPPPDDLYSFDPVVAVDAANNFYVAFGAAGTTGVQDEHRTGVWVARAATGTTSFDAPSEVTDPADSMPSEAGPAVYWFDKPWITVTTNQEIVVTYARLEWATCTPGASWAACVSNIMLSRSADAKSWTRTQLTTNTAGSGPHGGAPDHVNFAFPCASITTNRLWVVYNNYPMPAVGVIGVRLQFSDDDGATFGPSTEVSPATAAGVHSDPSCAGSGDDVWVAYELESAGTRFVTSIPVAHSTDGGQTFGDPVNALDTATTKLAWHSTLVREPTGALDVEYYGGATTGDTDAGVYHVRSTNGGTTWGEAALLKKPVTLSDSGPATKWADSWLGDYLGLAVAGGQLFTTFTDNSSGPAHVGFVRAKLP